MSETKAWVAVAGFTAAVAIAVIISITVNMHDKYVHGYKTMWNNAPLCYGPACEECK